MLLGHLLIAAVFGCERSSRPRATSVDTAATVAQASDSVVGRVVRGPRAASALQRVSGSAWATRAFQPLDTVLAVRVLGPRGRELAGVPVRWAIVTGADGAQLRAIDARTDSLGVARASFMPGGSADVQVVGASVDGVGRLDFKVRVAPAAIRIVADRVAIWSGETPTILTVVSDSAGRDLTGGDVSWASSDTSVLRILDHAGTRASVSARLAGTTSLIAWIGDTSVRHSVVLGVKPVLRGRFITLDGSAPPRMRVSISAGGVRDSVAVVDGQFEKRVDLPASGDVDVAAEPFDDSSVFHRVALRIVERRDLQRLTIALVPIAWRIDAGSYQGRVVRIDAASALRRASDGSPFWRLVPRSAAGPRTLLGWRSADLPLRIAFDRSRFGAAITPDDSVRFWAIAEQLERDVGVRLFAPAVLSATDTSRNAVRVEIEPSGADGHTFVTWGNAGDASDGVLRFSRIAFLSDAHVVSHELLHLLGFGHAFAWPTVALPAGGTEQRLTPEDVAYVQLATRLRRLRDESGARPGVPIARQ
ncbi:MAG TPA: hypothetical protein VFT29_08575 [Gemmatimonadaceae bacterium]|nr:hypothetical protein [Gemmatimonadaceae bacterium]